MPNPLEVRYHDPAYGDAFTAGVQGATPISSNLPGFSPNFLYVQIAGPTGMLSSGGLPTTIDLSKVAPYYYGNATEGIVVANYGNSLFQGYFDSLQFQEVPEPAIGVMLGLTLAGLSLRSKFSNSSAKRTY